MVCNDSLWSATRINYLQGSLVHEPTMAKVEIDTQSIQFCAEVVHQSRANIRLRRHPVAQRLLEKLNLVTESPTSPAITKLAGRSLQRENSITLAMETIAAEAIFFDQRSAPTVTSRQAGGLAAARTRSDDR
jgi:hypothetical protein